MMYKMFVHWWFDWASQPERLPAGRAACLPWPPWLLLEGFQTKLPAARCTFEDSNRLECLNPRRNGMFICVPFQNTGSYPQLKFRRVGHFPLIPRKIVTFGCFQSTWHAQNSAGSGNPEHLVIPSPSYWAPPFYGPLIGVPIPYQFMVSGGGV